MQPLIAPSILSVDFTKLGEAIDIINRSEAEWVHIDIMDGVFVPNISIGMPVVNSISKHSEKPLDVHLMIVDPDRYIERFKTEGANILTIHMEACNHLHRSIQAIKKAGMKAGVVLNPHTPIETLNDIIIDTDLVLLMSVNPGYGGQKFIENTYSKIAKLKDLIIQKKSDALIEIDGGVDISNARKLTDTGADILVAGSAVFNAPDPVEYIRQLKNC
ncbi:MAG: ribulose-phosphate 3-epimerase [Bacteroidota bacterium]